jgi:hypothetical protein
MKKYYALLAISLIAITSNGQNINIPSAYFKTALINASPSYHIAKNLAGNYFKIDANNDSEIQVSEALNVSYLDVNNLYIGDLTGIAFFTNLSYLICNNNLISNLDISNLTSLVYLNCAANSIQNLNLNNNTALTNLICKNNSLVSLDLTYNTALLNLDCSSNILMTSLNVSSCSALQTLNCFDDDLQSLNVSNKLYLTTLECSSNSLTSLNVSGCGALYSLKCHDNYLSSIVLNSNTQLHELWAANNHLTTLDLNSNYFLIVVTLDYNYLTTLFYKNGNYFSTLEFNHNPNIAYVCTDEVSYVQTIVNNYGYAATCQVNNYCSFTPGGTFYTIQGYTKYDGNNNGCSISDINYPNLKFNLSNGTNSGVSICNTSGNYTLPVQAGTHSLSPILENPTYFTISPSNTTVIFPTQTSPYTQNFCVTANGTHNDLEVALLPILAARPGLVAKYKIIYKNKGTAAQSGSVNLSFDDSRLDYVSAVPSLTTQATSSLSWSFSNLLPFETREILVTLNVNSPAQTPAVNSGDVLTYTATVTGANDETPNDNVSTLNQTAVNAFDPNDKTCIEGTTVSPSMVGQYVHYIVRFENDGTANAQNIVVKDMIDTTKFDISSLIPLSGSASYTTRITNTNQVEFIFQNINLPFAAGTNTGYVAFKIKTLPTLVVGNTFSNTANIYFDYNAPIVTNTATTTIAILGTQDFDFGSVFTLSPVPAKNSLTITTKQDVVISSLSIYNTLGQLIQINTNPAETIDVSGLQSGSYFVRITSDKGSATGKFIKA